MKQRQSRLASSLAYTPYGLLRPKTAAPSLGFNGHRTDPLTGHYHLGAGYRSYNPALMRYHSPDDISPFGAGGVNYYTYCGNNPINYKDPTGHMKSSTRASTNQPALPKTPLKPLKAKYNDFMKSPLKSQPEHTSEWAWDLDTKIAPVAKDPWTDDLVARTLHNNGEIQTWAWELEAPYEAPTKLDPWTYKIRNSTQQLLSEADSRVNILIDNLPADLDTRAISLSHFSREVRQGGSSHVVSLRVGLIGRVFD